MGKLEYSAPEVASIALSIAEAISLRDLANIHLHDTFKGIGHVILAKNICYWSKNFRKQGNVEKISKCI